MTWAKAFLPNEKLREIEQDLNDLGEIYFIKDKVQFLSFINISNSLK